jgi:hypothetical protein
MDPGSSDFIAVPASIPPGANPGAIYVIGWSLDTGHEVFRQSVGINEPIAALLTEMPRAVFVVAYDGDDGTMIATDINRRMTLDEIGSDVPPDQLCRLCDPDVEDEAPFVREDVHDECLLANTIGHIGHLLDHDFWCSNMGDQYGGRTPRESALAVAKLVEKYGFMPVASGTFPREP